MATTTPSMTSETMSKANSSAADFKNKVMSSDVSLGKISHSAGEKIGEMASGLANTTREYVENGREYVKENPAKSIAIAAAAGAAAGSLITYLMQKRK